MRLAVVGNGKIVQEFLPQAAEVPGLELAAIVGRESARATLEDLRERHGIGAVYTDYAAALADPGIDAVWIALPNSLHYAHAKQALEAGVHVICEKPFVLAEEQLAELRALAEERGLILVEAITTVDLPAYRWLQENLGRVGDLRMIQCEYSQYSSRFDAFREGTIAPAFDPAQGGGALMDLGVYTVHFVLGLLGAPSTVQYTPTIERGVDTSGVLTLGYEDAVAVCVTAKDSGGPVRTKIQGTAGALVVEGPPNVVPGVDWYPNGAEPERIELPVPAHRMIEEFRAFVAIVDGVDLAERDRRLDHSQRVLATTLAAARSAGLRLGEG